MKLEKYSDLRKKIKGQTYEDKYSKLETFTYIFSWLGNLGSIFFAYFLLFPATIGAIESNITSGDIALYSSMFVTILFLMGYELIKREVISNLSFDLINNKFKITKKFFGLLLLSFGLIAGSFYFSLNGAKNFANNKKETTEVINQDYQLKIDSLTLVYENRKQTFISDNNNLMEDNSDLREKITETPLNYVNTRKGYQDIIDKNVELIANNDRKVNQLDQELQKKIDDILNQRDNLKKENSNKETENIFLFLIISTFIEILIILGVYFRQFYTYNVYLENEGELEEIVRKKDRYRILLQFLYKEGEGKVGDMIMGKSKLKQLIDEKSNINDSSKFIDEFIEDMTYLNILKLKGKRRVLNIDYEKALEKLNKHDDVFRILENLR